MDHVGLDIIARNPHTHEVMGLSVKSRSRNPGTEGTSVSIPNDNLRKLRDACRAFGCEPYFAIVVDEADSVTGFILSEAQLVRLCPPGSGVISWKMSGAWIGKYEADPEIRSFRFITKPDNWWRWGLRDFPKNRRRID